MPDTAYRMRVLSEHTRHILMHMNSIRCVARAYQPFEQTRAERAAAIKKELRIAHQALLKAHALVTVGEYSPVHKRWWRDAEARLKETIDD